MMDPRKQLARTNDKPVSRQAEEFEPLLSRRSGERSVKGSSARSRFVFHTSLFIIGLIGTSGCLWAMLYTSHGEEVAQNLGLHRVANSLENILSLLAYPVLMFSVILTLYAAQQLYRLYREATRPSTSRRQRRSE
ncbi:hypothetical protein ACUNV4_25550 [Granulosicoccus sp. 3-233]|uniref:hypothetical protein n=1 Tax=Granulosicoccus sp. 3-233 TaxID=3417969 RepID=UPI003D3338FF